MFSINENEIEKLHALTFDSADKEWLRYISVNRTEKSAGDSYDLVVGPVANDQAIPFYEKLGMKKANDVMEYNHIEWTPFTVK